MGSKTWSVTAATSDWNDTENWQEKEVPEDGDDIVIPSFDTHDVAGPEAPAFTAGKLDIQGGVIYGGPITVTKELSWSAGHVSAQIVLASTGTITVGDESLALEGAVTNNGELTVTGAGDFDLFDGAGITNAGVMIVSGAVNFRHTAGASVTLTQQGGTLSFTSLLPQETPQVTFNGGVFTLVLTGGTTTVDTIIQFNGGSYLQFNGGDLSGQGTVIIADGGEIDCPKPGSVKNPLTLTLDGGLALCGDVAQTDIRLTCEGTLQLSAGSLQGRIHLTNTGTARWPADNTASIGPGCLVVENHLKVTDGDAITMTNTGELLVGGRMTFLGSASVTGGVITNVGLIVADTDGATVAVNSEVLNTDTTAPRAPGTGQWPFTGDAVKRGAIVIDKSHVSSEVVLGTDTGMISGTLHVKRAGTGAAPTLDGNTFSIAAAASLRACGTLPLDILCDGRIEVVGDGTPTLHLNSLALTGTARLELPASCWQGDPALSMDGRLTPAGALCLPTPPQGAIEDQNLIIYNDKVARFGRIDMPGGFTLTQSYNDQGYVVSAATRTSVPGFDKSVFPGDVTFAAPKPPVGVDLGSWVMQQLFENTEFAYVGFYLAPQHGEPTHGRIDTSWMDKYDLLREQGWGIIPIYWGTGTKPPAAPLTVQQAQTDAQQAATLAQRASIPNQSSIFFDVEETGTPAQEPALTAYLNAWCDALGQLGYVGQIYAPFTYAPSYRMQRNGVRIWIPTLTPIHGQPANPTDDSGQVVDVDRGAFTPKQNGAPLNPPADLWQWCMRYTGVWTFLDSSGVSRTPKGVEWDFDTGWTVDPSTTATSTVKQYNTVKSIQAAQSPWKPGSQTATITLSRVAARPGGAIVLISSSSGEVQAPIQIVIPAGQNSATVAVDAHLVDDDTDVTLFAWTPRQTLASAATTTVTVTAPQ